MNRLGAIGLVAAAMLVAAPAMAATFDYSYTFDTGDVVSGSFDGDLSGELVTNLSNITANLNGTPFNGSPGLTSFIETCNFGCYGPGGVASFDVFQNNFVFSDAPDVSSPSTNFFYMIPWYNNPPEATQYFGPTGWIDYYNSSLIAQNWSLTEVDAGGVPEPGTWALLIAGLGLAGFALRRRAEPAAA